MMRELSPALLVRLTQIDYDREMALIARTDGDEIPLGVVRLHADPDNAEAEFAILVRSDWHGRGLGTLMMHAIIDHARNRGIGTVTGSVLRDNSAMLTLMHEFGFAIGQAQGDEVTVRLPIA
jgi:acetyltransferase